jgi:hypothetical protein
MFSPKSRWSPATQGYLGTTHRTKDSTRGSSLEKTTIALGNGYTYDKAEAARLLRLEELRYETDGAGGTTRLTEQGEKRAKEAKEKPPPFSTRSPKRSASPKKPVTRSDTEAARKAQEEAGASTRRSSRRADQPPISDAQKWNPKTQGYDGYYNWRLGK